MEYFHQWLPIVSLLMITISGTLATLSVKGNNGSVLIAKKNNRGNIKIKEDIGDFTDMRIQLTNPYTFNPWGSNEPAQYQLQPEHATLNPSKQPYPVTGWGSKDTAKYQSHHAYSTPLKPRYQSYPYSSWGSKDTAKYQSHNAYSTPLKPRNQPYPNTSWEPMYPAQNQLHHEQSTTQRPRNQPSHTKKPAAAAAKNVKQANPTKSHTYLGAKSTTRDLVNSSTPRVDKVNPISIKNNNGTILVAGKNNRGNTKIKHDISQFDAFN